MDLEKMLKAYKEQTSCTVREERVLETIEKSKEILIQIQQDGTMSYREFLFTQFRLIRKRWWLLQAFMLMATSILLPSMQENGYLIKSMGIIGVLFVVMMIPELWRNRSNDCMQIEATCLYSLRQIYSARLSLIGIVDVFLITIFCVLSGKYTGVLFADLLVSFLFPVVVASGICFAMLCSNKAGNEATSIFGCFLWCGLWWSIVVNEAFYSKISYFVWVALFAIALIFLIGAIYKTIQGCNKYWEVDFNGTATA